MKTTKINCKQRGVLKRVGGVLLSLLLVFSVVLPSGVTVRADEKPTIPFPTNLRWSENYPQDAVWDLDASIDEDDVYGIRPVARWQNGGMSETKGKPQRGYFTNASFGDFMKEKGEGEYSFYVLLVASETSEYSSMTEEDVVWSDPQQFYQVNLEIVTLDTEGAPSTNYGGEVDFIRGTSTQAYMSNDVFVYPESSAMNFVPDPNVGYEFKGFTFSEDPADLVNTEEGASFTLSKSVTMTATFQKNDTTSELSVDFGSKHTTLAGEIAAAISAGEDYPFSRFGPLPAEVNGSVVTVQVPKAGAKEYTMYEWINEILSEYLWDEEAHTYRKDEGEYIPGYKSVAKNTTTDYTSEEAVYDEWETAETVPLGDTLSLNVLWLVKATSGSFTVDALTCDTEVTTEETDWGEMQKPIPVASADEGSEFESPEAYADISRWFTTDEVGPPDIYFSDANWYKGTVAADDVLFAGFPAVPVYGYFVDASDPPTILVNGTKAKLVEIGGAYLVVAEVPPFNPVAKNVQTGKEYSTLQKAYDEVEEKQTIQLLRDIDLGDGGLVSTKTYTLDLNGKELSGSGTLANMSTYGVVCVNGGTLTIEDSSGNNSGKIHNTHTSGWRDALAAYTDNKATVIIKGGTMISDKGNGIAIYRGNTVTIEGGHVSAPDYTGIMNYGTLTVSGDNTVIEGLLHGIENANGFSGKTYIEGGTIRSTGSNKQSAIKGQGNGLIEISGGNITGRHAIETDDGNITITFPEGSTATVTGTAYETFNIKKSATVNIYGGRFSDQEGNKDKYNRTAYRYLLKEEGGNYYVLTPPTFKEIVWDTTGDEPTAKALYQYGDDTSLTEEVECAVEEKEDAKKTVYTATISADDSPDGKEHSDEKTVYNVYNLYVQGKHVTGEIQDDILGDGTVKYDPKTNTLTLNNATIEASRRKYGDDGMEYGIRAHLVNDDANLPGAKAVEGPLTIELIGENTIQNETVSEGTTKVYGVANESQTKLTFTGGGSLNIDMQASGADGYTGIEVRNALEFNGVAVKIGMDGSKPTRGLDVLYSNPVKLSNGAEVHIKTGDHADTYAFYNNRNNQDLTVEDGCVFEAVSDHLAFHQINITDGTKPLGALVNTKATKYEAEFWDEQTNLNTYKYVRIPAFRLTIHWSSVDGEDLMDPVKIGVTPGTSIQDAVKILDPDNVYGAYYPFEMEGYDPVYVVFVKQPLSAFKDSTPSSLDEDISGLSYGGSEAIDDDLDVYFFMFKAVGAEPSLTLAPPVCGTEVVTEEGDVITQTNRPEFTVAEGEPYSIAEDDGYAPGCYWAVDNEDFNPLSGTLEGGKTYYTVLYLDSAVGYYFDKDITAINGADEVIESWNEGDWIRVVASVKAVHDMEEHPGKEATCTEDGNKPYNVCKACDKWFVDSEGETEIEDHDEVVIPALGHDWDEGKVTKESTATEPGVMTYTCNRCGETKTEEIPPTGEDPAPDPDPDPDPNPDPDPDPDPAKKASYSNTVGNGNVWEKGSGTTSDFTFMRSENDEETFAHFTYADVDGKKLKEGVDCEISAGSVIIKLKPAYLETLAVGEHTLTAHFDDGNSASAKFTVTNKSIKPTPVTPSDKGKSAPKTGDNNMPYIGIWLMMFGLAGLFLLSRKRVFARRK